MKVTEQEVQHITETDNNKFDHEIIIKLFLLFSENSQSIDERTSGLEKTITALFKFIHVSQE